MRETRADGGATVTGKETGQGQEAVKAAPVVNKIPCGKRGTVWAVLSVVLVVLLKWKRYSSEYRKAGGF